MSELDFDPHAGAFAEHPYPVLNRLREEQPVSWNTHLQAFVVTRYEDVKEVINNEGRFVPELPVEPSPKRRNFIVMNGEEHKEFRRVVSPAFARNTLAKTVEPLLTPMVDELIDGFIAQGSADLVAQFAVHVPADVMRAVLEMPELDANSFMADAEISLEYAAHPNSAELQAKAPAAIGRMRVVLDTAIERSRAESRGGLLGHLLNTTVADRPLTHLEVQSFCAALVIAGVETTQRLITNAVYALCRHPDQYDALLKDHSLLAATIEETLRYFPPNHFRMRYAIADEEIQGVKIAAGSKLYAMTGGANRDPRVFEEPDAFNIFRDAATNKHLSFGYGIHQCLGAALARVETTYALRGLLERFGRVEIVDDEPITFLGFRNRSPVRLPITFAPARAGASV